MKMTEKILYKPVSLNKALYLRPENWDIGFAAIRNPNPVGELRRESHTTYIIELLSSNGKNMDEIADHLEGCSEMLIETREGADLDLVYYGLDKHSPLWWTTFMDQIKKNLEHGYDVARLVYAKSNNVKSPGDTSLDSAVTNFPHPRVCPDYFLEGAMLWVPNKPVEVTLYEPGNDAKDFFDKMLERVE